MDARQTDMHRAVALALGEILDMGLAHPLPYDDPYVSEDTIFPLYTVRAAMYHNGMELGLKCLCAEDDVSAELAHSYRSWGHNLLLIYEGLEDKWRIRLNDAFMDAVRFYEYPIQRDEWAHMRSFEDYLRETGDKSVYMDLRYWVIDAQAEKKLKNRLSHLLPDLFLGHEMTRFMSFAVEMPDIATWHFDHISVMVETAIERHIDDAIVWLECGKGADADALRRWIQERGSMIEALKVAYMSGFNVLDDWGNAVLKAVFDGLHEQIPEERWVRLALNDFFSSLAGRGSTYSDIDATMIKYGEHRTVIRMPSGRFLGYIEGGILDYESNPFY